MTGRLRDYQRAKVYRWEWETMPITSELLTLPECQRIVQHVFVRLRDEVPPTLLDGRGTRRAYAYEAYDGPGRDAIGLPKHARNIWSVCHEMAHIIVMRNYLAHKWQRYASHGREFVDCYRGLLADFNVKPLTVSEMELLDYGIDF